MKRGRGIVNKLIDNLPFELHLPNTDFCGPGTRYKERVAANQTGRNPLDRLCRQHDSIYHTTTDSGERTKADKELLAGAWKRVTAPDSSVGERLNSLITSGAMGLKVLTGSGVKKRRVKRIKKKARILPFVKLGSGVKKRVKKVKKKSPTKRTGGAFYLRQYRNTGSGLCSKSKSGGGIKKKKR